MTERDAILICERLGVDPDDKDDIDSIIEGVARINYGEGFPSQEELDELRRALEVLQGK